MNRPASVRLATFCMSGMLFAIVAGPAWGQPLHWTPQRNNSSFARPTDLATLAAETAYKGTANGLGTQAILIRNPNTADGTPAFALADEYGQVQRYIEPSPGVDLASYVGKQVRVRRDTGETLLASQLDLPMESVAFPQSGQEAIRYDVAQAAHSAPPASRQVPTSRQVKVSTQRAPRTAQIQPIVVENLGTTVAGPPVGVAPSGCSNCGVNRYGTPSNGGFVVPYQSCNSCSPTYAYPCSPLHPGCGRGSRGRFYGRVEYLLWQFDGMHLPPLVTSSPAGTPQAEAGVLGQSGTTILYGNGNVLDGHRDGLRLSLGTWLNDYRDIGLEGDLLFFSSASTGFSRTGTAGAPILARPFFNMVPVDGAGDFLPAAEDAELVSFPGVVDGTVSVSARSEFSGVGLRARFAMCCQELGSGCNSCDPCAPVASAWGASRIDVIAGYRYLQLDEQVIIREDLTSLQSNNPGEFDIYDRFDTSNRFHGADVGFIWEWETSRWSFEFLSKVAIGSTKQNVNIRGETTVSNNGASFTHEGGLLALQSNIGTYRRNVFTMIPELGVTLGYRVTPRLRATLGYTVLYWSRVARPGDHIDLDVNPNLLPPVVNPVVGPNRPRFTWDDTALLAHGLNLGLDYRF